METIQWHNFAGDFVVHVTEYKQDRGESPEQTGTDPAEKHDWENTGFLKNRFVS